MNDEITISVTFPAQFAFTDLEDQVRKILDPDGSGMGLGKRDMSRTEEFSPCMEKKFSILESRLEKLFESRGVEHSIEIHTHEKY